MNSSRGKIIVGLSAITLSYLGVCIRKSMDKNKLQLQNRIPTTLKNRDLPSDWMSQTQYGFDISRKKDK